MRRMRACLCKTIRKNQAELRFASGLLGGLLGKRGKAVKSWVYGGKLQCLSL